MTMKVSGVVNFEGLSAVGVRVLRDFENQQLSGLGFTFGPSPDRAVVRWDSIVRLTVIAHIWRRLWRTIKKSRESPTSHRRNTD